MPPHKPASKDCRVKSTDPESCKSTKPKADHHAKADSNVDQGAAEDASTARGDAPSLKVTSPKVRADSNSTDETIIAGIRDRLAHQIGEKNLKNWFDDKATLSLNGSALRVGIASTFMMNWMQRKFRDPLLRAAVAVLGPSAEIDFHVRSNVEAATGSSSTSDALKAEEVRGASASETPARGSETGRKGIAASRASRSTSKGQTGTDTLRRQYASLDDFVVGDGTELAMLGARNVCARPGQQHNPLFIYGPVGLGKTHLLEGIQRQIRRQHPLLSVMYLTAETFGNYFAEAIRSHSMPSFRQRFRSADVLILDDVQFFDAKRGFQKEFLHTFQHLEQSGKQIVLAADRHPRLLGQLSDELVTRFQSGLQCRIEPPDAATRRAIVQRKAEALKVNIAPAALDDIATRFTRSVRELEGAVNSVASHCQLTGARVSKTAARKVLCELERDCVRIVKIADIEDCVCKFFGVEADDLRSRSRARVSSQPRAVAMYLARELLGTAYSEIGRHFGGRNHSTVVAAERKVQGWAASDQVLQAGPREWATSDLLSTLRQRLA